MKYFKTTSLLTLLALFIFACKGDAPKVNTSPGEVRKKAMSENEAAQETLYDEVIAIHDEVMPKMSDINRVKRALKEHASGLTSPKCEFQEEDRGKIKGMVAKLEEADESMMQWMRDFKKPENVSHEKMMAFLEAEKVKISDVSDLMLTSLEKGDKLIKDLKKK